eukprot:TRINITY_DN1708_c0_g1_i1.p3 TRINITY_DN1708_c0_g1~~TRINITY_DN1708_c0_g1_i1.p3  ORF type:complete len:204 (-),score=111.70 TRINITY_DN1708_c0_g1_i1:79-636(-)
MASKRTTGASAGDDEFAGFLAPPRAAAAVEPPSPRHRALYLLCGLLASIAPAYFFIGVQDVRLVDEWGVLAVVAVAAAVVLSLAYHNVTHLKKTRFLRHIRLAKRPAAATPAAAAAAAAAPHKQAVASMEAVMFSLMYNNGVFLALSLALSLFLLHRLPVLQNYILSVMSAAAFASLSSAWFLSS